MNSWTDHTLEDILENLIDYRGKTPKKSTSGVRLVTAKVIKNGFINDEPAEYISDDIYDEWMTRGLPQKGDVLITTEAPLGEVAQLRTNEKIALAQRVILLRGNEEKLNNDFLFHSLKSDLLQQRIQARATGTTVKGIKQSELRQVRIPLPPIENQKRIASILNDFDRLILNNHKRIKILEEIAQRLYEEWFVHFKFPGHEKVKMVDSELGKIPEGWKVTSLGNITENFDRKRIPISTRERKKIQGVFPYYGASKIIDYVNDFIFDGRYLLLGEDGSVINSDNSPVLQLVDEKFWVSNHAHVLRGDGISTEFLYVLLKNTSVLQIVTGVAQPKINQRNLNGLKAVLPPDKVRIEYEKIIKHNIDLILSLKKQNSILTETRDLLLPRLIYGEIEI